MRFGWLLQAAPARAPMLVAATAVVAAIAAAVAEQIASCDWWRNKEPVVIHGANQVVTMTVQHVCASRMLARCYKLHV